MVNERWLHLMSQEAIARVSAGGFDVQLHTHRHFMPQNRDGVLREIADNRRVLQPAVNKPLIHLAYPTGFWLPTYFPWLSEAGIASASTAEFGLNDNSVNRFALCRAIDSAAVSALDFEAELSSVADLYRGARVRLRRLRGLPPLSNADRTDHGGNR
jgi:peptidoglycan/xylan/chitin deacetylase (PgdA/CDA1 family)